MHIAPRNNTIIRYLDSSLLNKQNLVDMNETNDNRGAVNNNGASARKQLTLRLYADSLFK